MSDNSIERVPQDTSRISLKDDWEVNYWMHILGVSRAQLEKLIEQNGTSTATVRQALGR